MVCVLVEGRALRVIVDHERLSEWARLDDLQALPRAGLVSRENSRLRREDPLPGGPRRGSGFDGHRAGSGPLRA